MRIYRILTAAFAMLPLSSLAAGLAPQPVICERACWGARAPSGAISNISFLNRAIVHHTASQGDYNTTSLEASKANVRATQNYHMDVNGWSDIGYHFLSCKLGFTFEGRAGSMTGLPRGAHDGDNTNSFGFNIMGYYHTPYNNVPTPESLDALYDVIAWRMPGNWVGPHGWPGSTYGSLGHQVGYVDSHRRVKATACPGDLIHNTYMGDDINSGIIRAEIAARMQGGGGGDPAPVLSNITSGNISDTAATITWNTNEVADSAVEYGTTTAYGSSATDSVQVLNHTVSLSGLTPATTYNYRVKSTDGGGNTTTSGNFTFTTLAQGAIPDLIVDNPAASVVGSWSSGTSAADKYGPDYRFKSGAGGSSYLDFVPNIPSAGTYQVYEWHPQGTNRTTGAQIVINHSGGSTAVSINQQLNGGRWNLLGSFNFAAGSGGNARVTDGHADTAQVVIADAVKFVNVPPVGPVPNAPTNLAGTAISRSQINLTWADNSGDETAFVLERKSGTGAYAVAATLGANVTSFSNTGLSRNTSYTYRVKATNGNGSSTYSNEITIKTLK